VCVLPNRVFFYEEYVAVKAENSQLNLNSQRRLEHYFHSLLESSYLPRFRTFCLTRATNCRLKQV